MVKIVKSHNMKKFCFVVNTLSTEDFEEDD